MILNEVNGKIYVGSSSNLTKRLRDHRREIREGIHENWKIRRDAKKLGALSFSFHIIYECDKDELLTHEQHFIDGLDAVNLGYNILAIANNSLGVKRTAETRKRISKSLIGRKQSTETRNLRRAAWSDDLRENQRQRNLGKKQSDSTKAKRKATLEKTREVRLEKLRLSQNAAWRKKLSDAQRRRFSKLEEREKARLATLRFYANKEKVD